MLRVKPLKRVLDMFNLSKEKDRLFRLGFYSLASKTVFLYARAYARGVKRVRSLSFVAFGLALSAIVGFSLVSPATSFAANLNTINFQARLMTSSGAIVPDGTYNLEFKLYNTASSSGSTQGSCSGDTSCLWVEDYTGSNRVNVVDGYLSVSLGSITPFPATINWNQPLWLTMNVGGTGTTPTWDGEMNPRMPLTAIPYAFMANSLATQTGSYQSTLNWTTQTASNSLLLPNLSGTLCVDGESDGCGLGANYIQNSTGEQLNSNFYISGNGQAATSFEAPLVQSASGNLTIQGASGTVSLGTSTNLTAGGALTIASGGSNTNLNLNNNGTGAINIGTAGSASNSIQIGNVVGAVSQTINIGTNATSGSVTNLSIGSPIAGTLTLQDSGVSQTFNGNTVAFQPKTSSNNSTTTLEVNNASSSTILAVDTSDGYVGVGTNAPSAELNVSGANLQPASVTSGNGITASSVVSVSGANGGSTSATTGVNGGAGAAISLQAGSGGSSTGSSGSNSGGSGGNVSIIAGSGGSVTSSTGTAGSGGQLLLMGGAVGTGGATAGSPGSVVVKSNGTNSLSAFEIQNAAGANVVSVDTVNGRVGIGAAPANGVLTVGTSSTTTASGGLYFGSDTDLYRSGVNSLKTDGSFTATSNLLSGTGNVTFNFNPNVTAGSSAIMLQLNGSSGIPGESDVFTAQGNLGLGTTSPSANLSFNQAGATINVNQSTTGVGGNLTIQGGEGDSSSNYNGGNLILEGGLGSGTDISGSVIVQSNATNSTSAFEIQNAAGNSNLLVADTANSKIGIAEIASSTGNTLQVAGGITATTGGILVSSGGESIVSGGLNLNSTGITNTGLIAGATTYNGNNTLTLSGTNANELAVTGAPIASSTSSLVQLGNVIASGNTNGTYLGINAPSGNLADFLNFEENGTVVLQLAYNGALTTGSTINGQTISANSVFTGTVTVGSLPTTGTSLLCQNGGEIADCSSSVGNGNYIYNTSSTLQTAANINIQSASASSPTVQLQDIASQTADLLDFKNSSGTIISEFTANGNLQGANGAGSNQNGGALTISGGQGTGLASGGNIQLQIAQPGTVSGGSLNALSTIATFSGATGGVTFQNAVNSTTGFQVQGTSAADVLDVNTANSSVGIGTNAPLGQLNIQSTSYMSEQVIINDGTGSAPPSIPNGYLPSLLVQTGETNASRPLFFGYPSGSSWASFLTAGACTSFNVMCLDMGSGSSVYTALESNGSTLNVGGNGDNSFAAVDLYTSGSATPVATFATNGAAVLQNSTNSSTAFEVNNSSGSSLLGVDTLNNNIYLGSTTNQTLSSNVYIASSNSTSNVQGVTIGSNANASDSLILDGGTAANAIQIGNSSTAHGIEIGTSASATQIIALGSSAGGSTVSTQAAGSSTVLSSNGFDINSTSSTALLVQNASTDILSVDTVSGAGASAVNINSGVSGVSGLQLSDISSTGGCTGYCSLLGVNSSGQVGVSNAAVSLTSPALAYWDGLNNPTTGSQSYPTDPIASFSGSAAFSSGNGVLLNPATANTSGSINWSFAQVPFEEIQFQFKAGGGSGADATWFYSYASGVPTTEFGSTATGTLADGYIIYFSEYHNCIGIAYGSFTDGNQCVSGNGTAGDPLAAVSMPPGTINDNNWHNIDIQFFENKIYVRWDGNLILQYSDVYTRDLADYQDFGFGARSGSSTDNHYIRGLLVSKLSSATQYNVDTSSPLASDLYWENTNFNGTGAGNLGIGTSAPTSNLQVAGSTALTPVAESGSVGSSLVDACISNSTTSCSTTAGTDLFGSGTSFNANMVGDKIVFSNGTTATITGYTSATLMTVSTSVLEPITPDFAIEPGGLTVNNATSATTDNVIIGANTTFGGNMYTDQLSNSNGTTTIANAAYGYDLGNTSTQSGTNGTTSETFNITGLPSTEGTTAFIDTECLTSGNGSCTIIVQINGIQMSSLLVNTKTTGYDDYIVIYVNGSWRIVGQGPEANGTYTQGADYAEWIDYSGNSAPQPGDVLTVGSSPTTVTDSTVPYDPSLIGVVSTQPYQVGGTNDGHSVILALTGRVPVKVSLQNGPIKAGDPLTSSSTPGVAMKATGPGDIIGTALEGYNGTEPSNEIMVQLHVGYDNPNAQNGVLQGDQNVTGNLSVVGNTTIGGNATIQGSLSLAGGLSVGGVSNLTSLTLSSGLTDKGNLQVDGTAELNTLQSQNGAISGNFNVAGSTSLASLLVGNNLTVNGGLTVSGMANLNSLNVSGNTTTATLNVNGTLTLGGDIQLSGKVNTAQAVIKTFTATVPITAGSVVVIDTSPGNVGNVTTTTTPDDNKVIGVAISSTTSPDQPIQVAIGGWVEVNVNTAKVNNLAPPPISPGQLIVTGSTPGTVMADNTPTPGSILGKSTSNQSSNNQVWILITLD